MTNYKTVFQLAQEKGYQYYFDGSTAFIFNNVLPELSVSELEKFLELTLIQKWLREEHKIDATPAVAFDTRKERQYFPNCVYIKRGKNVTDAKDIVNKCNRRKYADTKDYEQALIEGVSEALKLLP